MSAVELDTSRPFLERRMTKLLLFLFVLSIVGPLVHPYADQQASRYTLTAAIWENQSVTLDGFEHAIGQDAAFRDGHFYSDKAPLQPVMAVPFYGVFRMVGGESATIVRAEENLGLWWQTFWFAAVPLSLLSVLVYQLAGRTDRRVALPAALSIVAGTILFPFGSMLFGHELAALFLTGSLILLTSNKVSPIYLMGSGALLGAAVAAEYPVALAIFVVGAFVVWRVKWRTYWFVLGGLPFVLFLGIYHTIAFGSPLSHPYRYNVFSGVVENQKAFFEEFSSFQFDNFIALAFSGRGFLIASPIVVLGLVGLVHVIRRRRGLEKGSAVLFVALFTTLMMLPLFWGNPWGGFSPGPRYMAPALPVAVVGVVAAWSWRPYWTRIVVALSVLTMVLATITNPLVDVAGPGGLGTWVGLAFDGDFVPSVFTMLLGDWGWLVHGAVVSLFGVLLYREWNRGRCEVSGQVSEDVTTHTHAG